MGAEKVDVEKTTIGAVDELATGSFVFGLLHEGKRHREFAMRLPTLADNIAVVDAWPEAPSMQIELALFARCMQRLGEVPKSAITYELLAQGLMPVEYDVMQEALGQAKKKLLAALAD